MKKAVSIVGVLAAILLTYGGSVFLFASSNVVAAEPKVKLYLAPATATAAVGSTVSFQVRVTKNTTAIVDYVNADMNFPTTNLEVVSISKQGSYFSENSGPTTAYSNAVGTISIKGEGNWMPIKADVLVATVTFKALKVGSASVSFSQKSQVGDMKNGGNVKNVMDASTGSIVTISSTPVQPTSPTDTEPDEETTTDDEDGLFSEEDDGSGSSEDEISDESDSEEEEFGGETSDEEVVAEDNTTNDDSELGDAPTAFGSGDDSSQTGSGTTSFWQQYLWPLIGVGVLGVAATGWGVTTLVMRRRKIPAVPLLAEESAGLFGDQPPLDTNQVGTVPGVSTSLPVDSPATPLVKQEIPSTTPNVGTEQPAPAKIETPVASTVPHIARLTVPDRPVDPHTPLKGADDIPDMFDIGEQRLQSEGLADMKSSAQHAAR